MPAFRGTDDGINNEYYQGTSTLQARAENSSEAVALPNGQKALTPIIAGAISGTCIGVAWLVALIVILVKRFQRKKRYKRVGQGGKLSEEEEQRAAEFIVPPDPAVLQGSHLPGERIVLPEKRKWWKRRRRAKSLSREKGKARDEGVPPRRRQTSAPESPSPREQDEQLVPPTILVHDEMCASPQGVSTPTHPAFHRLSTIVSVAMSQRSSNKSPPPNGDASQRDDVNDIDFVSNPPATASADASREHTYPPSRRP